MVGLPTLLLAVEYSYFRGVPSNCEASYSVGGKISHFEAEASYFSYFHVKNAQISRFSP
jgi:hypothetical protein